MTFQQAIASVKKSAELEIENVEYHFSQHTTMPSYQDGAIYQHTQDAKLITSLLEIIELQHSALVENPCDCVEANHASGTMKNFVCDNCLDIASTIEKLGDISK